MKTTIAKFEWLEAGKCEAMTWHALRTPSVPPNEAGLFRMQQGQEVGALARQLYPHGVFVSAAHGKTTSEVTQQFIADDSVETLFEAAFLASPFVAKADVLRRQNGAWHVLEVKSSFADSDEKKHLDDLAYTVMVAKRSGLAVAQASLVLLSRGFRFGDGPERLFEIIDKTEEAAERADEFAVDADSIAKVLFAETPPAAVLVSACRDCALFAANCVGSGIDHTVLEIPGLHHTKLKKLSAMGIIDLAHFPDDLNLNERQERAKYAVLSGNTVIEPGLGTALESIEWPCHYLDFETVATALPIYEGHGCHQQVVTQFSIHHRDNLQAEPNHSEYLADPSKDCQRELAEILIQKLDNRGSIVVYSDFEEKRIKALQELFPDLAEPLTAILDRLKDLLPIIEDHVYHPNFHGSFSIKKVLPALVTDLSYDGLDVADGDTAITRFARMARGEISGDDIAVTRTHLLRYCERDTLAMVRLHEALVQLAGQRQRAGS